MVVFGRPAQLPVGVLGALEVVKGLGGLALPLVAARICFYLVNGGSATQEPGHSPNYHRASY